MTNEIYHAAGEAFAAEVRKQPRAKQEDFGVLGLPILVALRAVVDSVTPLIEQRLLDRLADIYHDDGSIESRRIAMVMTYWRYSLAEVETRHAELKGPPSDHYAKAVVEQVLERAAATYEQEAAARVKALGVNYADVSYSPTAVIERLRHWRDNPNELVDVRGGDDD